MGTLAILPLATYATGSYPFDAVPLPHGTDQFQVVVARCTSSDPLIWPSRDTTIHADLQFSYDGGKTFSPPGSNWAGPTHGGVIQDKLGNDVPVWSFGWRFVPDATHVKGVLTIEGGEVRTEVILAGV